MNNSYSIPAPCPPPDAAEKREIRKYYFRISLIMIALVAVFTFVNKGVLILSSALAGGGFTKECIKAGKKVIENQPVMRAIYSYAFPIAADIAAIMTGLAVTNADLKKKLKFKDFTVKGTAGFIALCFGISTVGSLVNTILSALITSLFGADSAIDTDSVILIQTAKNPLWLDVLIYLYVCLIGPILEELIFRGVLLEGLRKYGNSFGIIMSSVMFGLMHQNFIQCFPAICMGLIFAYAAVKTDSIIPSIFAHILNNSLSALLMIMLEGSPLLEYAQQNDIMAMADAIMEMLPIMAVLMVNLGIRLVCLVVSVIIAIRFFSNRRVLFAKSDYCRDRTWGLFFTSIPWIAVTVYLLFTTITSLF